MKTNRMRKLLSVLLSVSLIPFALCAAGAEEEICKLETAADADAWIAVFLGEHPEDLEGAWLMTPQMEAAATQLGGLRGMAQSLAALGTPEWIGSAREGEIRGYKAFYIPCVFSTMRADLILVTQDGALAGLNTGPYSGETEPETVSGAFESRELALPVPELNGELPGTLLMPKGEGPFPAVVLVHGSGPNDRDETIVNLRPFRDLADGLAEMGIAVYRYDKRTYVYGAQMAADCGITPEDETIRDAAAAVQLLAAQEGIDPGRIHVLGHSLGGNLIPAIDRALRQQPVTARGYIMMAASPRPLDALMREQYNFLYSLLPEVTPEMQAEKDALFAALDKLADLDTLPDDESIAGAYPPYWRWLAAYDAAEAATEIGQPCLLLQGEEDYQVTMEDFRIWQETLSGKDNWTLISFPGLTHAFTSGQKTEGSAAYTRTEHVDEGVIREIFNFIAGTVAEP